MYFFFFRSALILRKLRKTNLTRDDPERSRKQVWNWYFKLTFGLQGKTIQRIMTPNFDRVSAVLSQKLYDLSLLLFIIENNAQESAVFSNVKNPANTSLIQIFFSLCGIVQIFLLTTSLEGFKVVLDNMLESAWVFFTAPHAKILKFNSNFLQRLSKQFLLRDRNVKRSFYRAGRNIHESVLKTILVWAFCPFLLKKR